MNKTKKLKIILLSIAIFALAYAFFQAQAASQNPTDEGTIVLEELTFQTNLSKAMEQAKEQNKHVFIYLHSENCAWCRKFENESFTNKTAINMLSNGFILLAIDTDRQSDIAQGLGAPYNPTMLFVDPEGNEVKRIVGYVQTAVFIEGIKEVFNHEHQH